MKPVRLQLSRKRGFNLQALSLATNGLAAVKVDRTTPYGNPFYSHPDMPRSKAFEVGLYKEWLIEVMGATHMRRKDQRDFMAFVQRTASAGADALRHRAETLKAAMPLLRGKNLACWCALPKPGEPDTCHAAVLLILANGDRP
jgi:hypothetical protein